MQSEGSVSNGCKSEEVNNIKKWL